MQRSGCSLACLRSSVTCRAAPTCFDSPDLRRTSNRSSETGGPASTPGSPLSGLTFARSPAGPSDVPDPTSTRNPHADLTGPHPSLGFASSGPGYNKFHHDFLFRKSSQFIHELLMRNNKKAHLITGDVSIKKFLDLEIPYRYIFEDSHHREIHASSTHLLIAQCSLLQLA